MSQPPTDLLQINDFDDAKTRIAKLLVNGQRLDRRKGKRMKAVLDTVVDQLYKETARVAADPRFRDTLISERITAKVPWRATRDQISKLHGMPVLSEEFRQAVQELAGSDLFYLVREELRAWRLTPSFTSLEEDGFAIVFRCNEVKSRKVCSVLYAGFAQEIKRQELTVEREIEVPMFKDLDDDGGPERYLRRAAKRRR